MRSEIFRRICRSSFFEHFRKESLSAWVGRKPFVWMFG